MQKLLFAGLASACAWLPISASAEEISFAQDIYPILERSCIECHGPEKDKGNLRLDSKEHAFASDYVIIPGDPEGSELYFLVTLPHDDPDVMPAEGEPLSEAETALLRQWIEEGARWEDVRQAVDFEADIKPILDGLSEDARATLLKWIEAGAVMPEPGEEKLRDYEITQAEAAAIERLRENNVGVARLAQSSNLVKIDFRGASRSLDDRLLKVLPDIKNLHHLDLSGASISDEDLSHLAAIPHLRRLNLSSTDISDAGLSHLSGLFELRYLNLYGTRVTDAGMAQLQDLQKLESLYLWRTEVTDVGVSRLKELLPELEVNTGFDTVPTVKTAPNEDPDPDTEEEEEEL